MKIIFIPGLLCNSLVWGPLNYLRHSHLCHDADVISFCSIGEMADKIIDEVHDWNNVAVIGISMGGYVAIDVALKMQNKLRKLILLNTTSNPVNQETLKDREKAIELAKQGKMNEVLEMSKGICYFKPKEEWLMLERKMAEEIGAQSYIKQQRAIINRMNYSPLIKNISTDTLIISAKEDKVLSYQDSIFMFDQMDNANLILLKKCGHLSTIEKGDLVSNHVSNFLELSNEKCTV